MHWRAKSALEPPIALSVSVGEGACLRVLDLRNERREPNSERARDAHEHTDRRIRNAALQHADIGAVYAGFFGELLLRQSDALAPRADSVAESRLQPCRGLAHGGATLWARDSGSTEYIRHADWWTEWRTRGSAAVRGLLIGLILTVCGSTTAEAGPPSVRWFVSHIALNGNSLLVGDEAQSFELSHGWSCRLGPTSEQLPLYEARQTICVRGDASFEFSVQCEDRRPKDHVQIRFRARDGRSLGFIDVTCELTQ